MMTDKSGHERRGLHKIIITGALGFIGQQIIPVFLKAGIELLLVGRSPNKLRARYGDRVNICDYSQVAE